MNFKKMTFLCMQRLTNFPYIEADFDALTNYELLCKVVEYLNKVIANENNQNDAINELAEAFINLKNYVDNLDLQDEVNNKLDEMYENGQLSDLVAQYLGLAGMITFDTVADMKQAENLVNGSKCCTLGYHEVNDGGNSFYKIRTVTNEDVIDNGSIIALHDNTLVAELINNGTVNFKQFGALGDSETNDYTAINNCVTYANNNNLLIYNFTGNYYINGEQIQLNTSIKNTDEVTFTLGQSYERYNSLFIYEHDSVTNESNVTLSTVFNDKNTLNNNYVGKSFILDTKIHYGQRLDGPDTTNTILEPFYTIKNYEYLWSIDYNGDLIVDVKNISDSFEKGFTFDGGKIEQYNTSSYGVSFLTVSRNNCIIKNLNIHCENTNGSNAVIHIDNGNNTLLENIYCNSQNLATASYNISIENCSNIITNHITGNNNSNTFGNRTVKNWVLNDSKVTLWDIHWNAFGLLTINNSQITGSMGLGYGSGIFTMKDSYCGGFLQTNQNYSPIFNGEIIIDNSYIADGVHVKRTFTSDSTRDSFFDNVILPNVTIKNSIRKLNNTLQDLYINIPSEVADLISTKGKILLDNVNLRKIYYSQNATATKEIYDSIIRDCNNLNSTMLGIFNKLGVCVCSGSNTNIIDNALTPNSIFNNDFTSVCKRNGNTVSIRCEGTVNQNITSSNYKLADIIEKLKPSKYSYGIITYDSTILPCYLSTAGAIWSRGNIASGTKIVITIEYILD